jgi:hypothetical protein
MTTQSHSCARLGLAHLMSTMILVGAAGLFLPDSCDAWVAAGAYVSAVTDQTPESHDWTADTTLQDPPDSPDDEDGPDAQQDSSSAIVGHVCAVTRFEPGLHIVQTAPVSMAARTVEGHFMRGPPAVEEDTSNLDEDDEDGDGDDDGLDAGAALSGPSSPGATARNRFLSSSEVHFLRLLPTGSLSLRAPPQ